MSTEPTQAILNCASDNECGTEHFSYTKPSLNIPHEPCTNPGVGVVALVPVDTMRRVSVSGSFALMEELKDRIEKARGPWRGGAAKYNIVEKQES